MAILNMFGGAGGGVRIPLESPTAFAAAPQDGKVILTWTDPVDKVATPGGEMVAPWSYTIVVRKIGSYPQTPKDGVEVTRETTRNQYQTTGYTDALSIENDITYYYAIFAVSTFGVWSEPATATAKPTGIHPQFYKSIIIADDIWSYHRALASTQNHFVLSGGCDDYDKYTDIDDLAFDGELTKQVLSTGYSDCYQNPGSFNGRAIFLAGKEVRGDADSFMRTSTLTRKTLSLHYTEDAYAMGIGSSDDHVIFPGGTDGGDGVTDVTALNTNFSSVPISSLSFPCAYAVGAQAGSNIVFFGGFDNDRGSNMNAPFAFSETLTKIENLAAPYQRKLDFDVSTVLPVLPGSASNGIHAIFGGGAKDGGGSVSTVTKVTTAYDQTLTRQPQLNLANSPVRNASGGRVGEFAMFGYDISLSSANAYDPRVGVSCFNNTLTRISNVGTIEQLSKEDTDDAIMTFGSGTVNNLLLFVQCGGPNQYLYAFQNV